MNTLSDKADPLVKGWCPGALRPMLSGDGLVVRVRPFLGRLRRAQADGLATLAAAHGNGLIDLSSRGNLQLRGVREDSFAPLLEGLRGLNLLDDTAEAESRRNILVMPFWQSGDETECLAAALTDALIHAEDLALPAKFGFAVDTGAAPLLQRDSADIRLERSTCKPRSPRPSPWCIGLSRTGAIIPAWRGCSGQVPRFPKVSQGRARPKPRHPDPGWPHKAR
jgi:sulfite reductase beta subunit-like hemoprotein